MDLTRNETIDDAIADMDRSGRSVEALVNNVGILHEKPLLDLTDSEIADSIAVHLTGPILLIRLATPAMVRRGSGRIVNISSGWGAFAEGMGGQSAPRTPESAADTAVWLATLPADGPTGGFFRDRKPIPW